MGGGAGPLRKGVGTAEPGGEGRFGSLLDGATAADADSRERRKET